MPTESVLRGPGPGLARSAASQGTQLYWGWGGALDATEFRHIEDAFVVAQTSNSAGEVTGALLVDSGADYLVDASGDYVKVT